MKITNAMFKQALDAQIISQEQQVQLVAFWKACGAEQPKLSMTHVLYYLGGLIAIGAMSVFMTLGWESFGGWGIVAISVCYVGIGLYCTEKFAKQSLAIPAGICATFVVALIPLIVYGLEKAIGWWPDGTPYREYHTYIKWHWVYMELATIVVGSALLWKYRYPFMVMPIAVTLWYLSMDLSPLIAKGTPDFILRANISLIMGLCIIASAFIVDVWSRLQGDYAFWLYLFGVITFWGGLSILMGSGGPFVRFIYFGINLLLIMIGVGLYRSVFVVFCAIGSCSYLGYLASIVFKGSWLFPIALTGIGFMIIYLGILWQKHEAFLNQKLMTLFPSALAERLQCIRASKEG